MLVIGLTGGIGSGKTTVARLFAEKGVPIIDSDQLARDVTHIAKPALQEIVKQFGEGILDQNGALNRNELRKKIFSDEKSRIWLEQLLHPLIRMEMKSQIDKLDTSYCIVVIPLLLETEKNPLIQRILVVDSLEETQIKRTQLRDNSTVDEIKAIMTTQINRMKRLQSADDIIENHGSLKDLNSQVDHLHGFYSALALKK